MIDAYQKGKQYEMHIAKLIRRKADRGSMRNKSSTKGWRRSDVFTNLPIHVEAKHHENIRLKEWLAQAEAAASFTQTPVVAFRIDEEDYAGLKFNSLLDLFVEIADLRAEIDDLRQPVAQPTISPKKTAQIARHEATAMAQSAVDKKKAADAVKFDKNGHITDEYGYCQQKGCKYNRTYKPPKGKK